MALILNIETATDICSIALGLDGKLLQLTEAQETFTHAEEITLLVQQSLKEAGKTLQDLDAVAITSGPGSYTALRIGTSTAKGICYALNKPLIAVNTLQALAQAAKGINPSGDFYVPMIDARRMEVYSAIYDNQLKTVGKTVAEVINENSYEKYFTSNKKIIYCGNGAPKCQTVITSQLAHFESVNCSAKYLIPLAEEAFAVQAFEDVAYYVPTYFKAPNITTPRKNLLKS